MPPPTDRQKMSGFVPRCESYTTRVPLVSGLASALAVSATTLAFHTPPVFTACQISQLVSEEAQRSQTTTLPSGDTEGFSSANVSLVILVETRVLRSLTTSSPLACKLKSTYATVFPPIAAPIRLVPSAGST